MLLNVPGHPATRRARCAFAPHPNHSTLYAAKPTTRARRAHHCPNSYAIPQQAYETTGQLWRTIVSQFNERDHHAKLSDKEAAHDAALSAVFHRLTTARIRLSTYARLLGRAPRLAREGEGSEVRRSVPLSGTADPHCKCEPSEQKVRAMNTRSSRERKSPAGLDLGMAAEEDYRMALGYIRGVDSAHPILVETICRAISKVIGRGRTLQSRVDHEGSKGANGNERQKESGVGKRSW